MNTERLYYQDPYLREFAAHVIGRQVLGGKPAVALDRTAFYPTGGGQPFDTGRLDDVPVVDVVADDGLVWHLLGRELAADANRQVRGVIDWPRRLDHMQQHTGQHILSQAFILACDAETVAFHLGTAYSTIDLNRTDLEPDAISAVEAAANAIVDDARPISQAFVTQEELARVPLRKPPRVVEAVRVVEVAGYDWSACGGTHVANTAQIGLIKIAGIERRGGELRVTFLCGRRARSDYARLQDLVTGLAARFTCGQDAMPDAVERLAAEHRAARKDLADLESQWVQATAAAWVAEAETAGAGPLVARSTDIPIERARKLAQALRNRPGTVVLLGIRGERPQLIFTRADDVPVNMGDLLRTAAAAGGGRGGGRPDWAQGGVPVDEALDVALMAARTALSG
jgi:alanyl-tRNA synthetase